MRSSKAVYLLTLLVILAGLWSYQTRIDISVRTRGIVRPAGDPIRVISEIGGRIKKFYGVEGASVRAGSPLVQLDTAGLALKRRSLEDRIHFTETRLS